MKLVAFTTLLSVLLVSSTVYLSRDQSHSELINLPGQSQQNDNCLTLFVKKGGFAYIVYDLYAQNLCQKSKKFTFLYQIAAGYPIESNVTQCLYRFQDQQTLFDYDAIVLSITVEDC